MNSKTESEGGTPTVTVFKKAKVGRVIGKKRGTFNAKRLNLSKSVNLRSLSQPSQKFSEALISPVEATVNASSTMELNSLCVDHLKHISAQILSEAGLIDWKNVVYNLLLQVTRNLNPDIRLGDDKDIRQYIKIKRIPGGSPSNSHYVSGVVFTKNVCHKNMQSPKEDPRILLL